MNKENNNELKNQDFISDINNNLDIKEAHNSSVKNKYILIFLSLILFVFSFVFGYLLMSNKKTDIITPVVNISVKEEVIELEEKEIENENYLKFGLVKTAFTQGEESASKAKPLVPSIPFTRVKREEIENLNSFAEIENIHFSEAQLKALESDGFFLAQDNITEDTHNGKDDFSYMYDSFNGSNSKYYREQNDAIFITSDLPLHFYHLLINRSFQRIEEVKFQPMLRSMTQTLFLDSVNKYNLTDDQNLKDSYKRLSVYYLIPLVVLDAGNKSAKIDLNPENFDTFAQYLEALNDKKIENSDKDLEFFLDDKIYNEIKLSDEIYELAKSELELIQQASGICASPLFTPLRKEFLNDYSQFKPRSHYTRNDILKSYFTAMMWYGRMGFVLESPELTRDALIITGQINNLKVGDEEMFKMWSDMSSVIDFFVGEVDDLTAYQYTNLIKKVYGNKAKEEDFSDEKLLNRFIETAKKDLPEPKIISEVLLVDNDIEKRNKLLGDIKQFRFIGQRFTPDAYILNNLTQGIGLPDKETGQYLPTMPTALMPIHLIKPDNGIVKNYLDEWINNPVRIQEQGRESDKIILKVLDRLKKEFANYEESVWTQNIYWSWLNCFRALLSDYGAGYPSFMQGENWQRKNLNTTLGSYTELKHDTLLYSKQSYSELGGGGDGDKILPPVVKGYVEPNLDFWNRIIVLAETTQAGLKERNVFPEEFEKKYEAFIDSSKFLRQIAEQELQNQEISDDDFEKLRVINQGLKIVISPILGQEFTKDDNRAGIIADIHTDAINQKILYEATGKPFIIYVAVKDINGTRLTRGVVFNHYEFTDTIKERLSDKEWQDMVYENKKQLPKPNSWSLEINNVK